jgi:uncharacterized protein (TIGR03000 family)
MAFTWKKTAAFMAFMLMGLPSTVHAGWGSVGGGGYGSSGGYSSVGSRPFTPIRSALRGIKNHVQAKFERHAARRASYGSSGSGYGSGGGYSVSYGSTGSYSGGSSGYSVSYGSTGVSYGSTGVSYGSTGVSYGSTGSYGVSYGSTGVSYGSTGISYGSTGSSYGVSYGSSGVSYGSSYFGESYGSTGSYIGGESYGSVGTVISGESYGSVGGEIYYGASKNSVSALKMVASSQSASSDSVNITVNLPATARVFVNDKPTTSTGVVRQFVSRGLVAGKSYQFDIRAELESTDGSIVKEERSLTLVAGAEENLSFAFADKPVKVETKLTLNVPAEATVTLGGNTTRATGARRTFLSQGLTLGQSWDNYDVVVQYEGQTKRQEIRLLGGDQLELTFDFADSLASNN